MRGDGVAGASYIQPIRFFYVPFTTYNKAFVVNTNLSVSSIADDRLEFWGQIGGYGLFLDLIKSNVIYVRLEFWGQRWGQRVPRKIRVIYFSKKITK